jgi:phosphoketolase
VQMAHATFKGEHQIAEYVSRLADRRIPHCVIYMIEPGKFRVPQSPGEEAHAASEQLCQELYPDSARSRVFVGHTRPEKLLGVLQRFNTGWEKTGALGFTNKGGTLTVEGMLFVNHTSWAHVAVEAARVLDMPREKFLEAEEVAALEGRGPVEGVII